MKWMVSDANSFSVTSAQKKYNGDFKNRTDVFLQKLGTIYEKYTRLLSIYTCILMYIIITAHIFTADTQLSSVG